MERIAVSFVFVHKISSITNIIPLHQQYFTSESRAGFEPANQGFADPAIGPLWYRDILRLIIP